MKISVICIFCDSKWFYIKVLYNFNAIICWFCPIICGIQCIFWKVAFFIFSYLCSKPSSWDDLPHYRRTTFFPKTALQEDLLYKKCMYILGIIFYCISCKNWAILKNFVANLFLVTTTNSISRGPHFTKYFGNSYYITPKIKFILKKWPKYT